MIEAAIAAARFVLGTMRPGAGLQHTSRAGVAKISAFLGDYAYMIRGLLALDRVTGDRSWQDAARDLFGEQQQRLGDPRGGWFTAAESNDVLFRSKDIFDGATPSAYAIAVQNALDLFQATTDESYLRSPLPPCRPSDPRRASGGSRAHDDGGRSPTARWREIVCLRRRLCRQRSMSRSRKRRARSCAPSSTSAPPTMQDGVRSLTVKIADGFHLHADLGTADGMMGPGSPATASSCGRC